jgi:hypothetical protein
MAFERMQVDHTRGDEQIFLAGTQLDLGFEAMGYNLKIVN